MSEASEVPITTTAKSAAVYLGHLPKEFEENEMRQFFKQFGTIKHLRLSRNKKTGASKHYAFIEFETPEVAEIVANTMNNYILFGHKLVCSVMDPKQMHPSLWKGANKEFVVEPSPRHFEKKKRTLEEVQILLKKRLDKHQNLLEKLEGMGIEYDFLKQAIKDDQKALTPFMEEEVPKKESTEKKPVRVVKRLTKHTKVLGK